MVPPCHKPSFKRAELVRAACSVQIVEQFARIKQIRLGLHESLVSALARLAQ